PAACISITASGHSAGGGTTNSSPAASITMPPAPWSSFHASSTTRRVFFLDMNAGPLFSRGSTGFVRAGATRVELPGPNEPLRARHHLGLLVVRDVDVEDVGVLVAVDGHRRRVDRDRQLVHRHRLVR